MSPRPAAGCSSGRATATGWRTTTAPLIPLAAERTRAALAAYRGGGGTLAAVLEARRMEIDTRMERLRLEMETAALWAQLEYLIPAEHDAAADEPRRQRSKEQQR